MKTNDKYKPQKERNEFSPFFKKIKECKRARINSIGKSQCTSKMTDSERFENMIHNFNKRTIIYNKLTEAIHVGLTLFTQKEACYLLEIKKTQYEKIISFPMFPMIRIGETIKEDFAKHLNKTKRT